MAAFRAQDHRGVPNAKHRFGGPGKACGLDAGTRLTLSLYPVSDFVLALRRSFAGDRGPGTDYDSPVSEWRLRPWQKS
jgi:hypothetical protein